LITSTVLKKEGQVIAATQDIYQNMKVLEEAGWDRNDPRLEKERDDSG